MTEYVDGADGWRQEVVGSWSLEKHHLLRGYVQASRAARVKMGGTPCLIDLYCGPGRIRVRDGGESAGGAVVAYQASITEPKPVRPFDQVFIADLDAENVAACRARLTAVTEATVHCAVGPAEETVKEIACKLPRRGIHIAYLDPYALFALPISVLRALAAVPNVDLVVHFAAADMSRNLQRPDLWDRFDAVAPGWRAVIPALSAKGELRRRFFGHWVSLLEQVGYHVAEKAFPVRNSRQREIYRLVLASKHPLGASIWNSLKDANPQTGFW